MKYWTILSLLSTLGVFPIRAIAAPENLAIDNPKEIKLKEIKQSATENRAIEVAPIQKPLNLHRESDRERSKDRIPPISIEANANEPKLASPSQVRDLEFLQGTARDLEPISRTTETPFTAQTEAAIEITNIRLNPTEAGIELLLETTSDRSITPSTSTVGNALIVEIPNAILSIEAFDEAQPIDGIARIRATNLPNNRVRIAITGTTAPPTAEVRSEAQILVVNITPGTPTSEAEEEDSIRVIVTAEKTPEDPQNVPTSLTVLGQNEIEDAQINTIRDVAANTPNFFTSVGDRAFNFYSIRGISNSNFLVRDSVGFYVDDIPIEYFHQLFPGELFDLERVEILRGPQNILYGRNSIAGAVNLISRPPSKVPEIQLSGEYGTYNQRRIQASFSDTAIPDRLGFRLSGVYSARDGFSENTFVGEDANDQSDLAGRFNLLWTPSERWSASLNILGAASQDGGAVYAALDQNDPFEIEENQVAELDLSVSAQALKVAYDGSDFRLTSITSHNFSNVGYRSDGDYTAQDIVTFNLEVNSNIWSQEFRLQSPKTAERLNWLVGGSIQNREFDIDQQQAEYSREAAAQFGIPDTRYEDTFAAYDQMTLAAFGQVDLTPIDPLTLTLGLRYEFSRDELDRSNRSETFDGVRTESGKIKDSIEGDTLLPQLAITYRLNPNIAAYGSITRGYRPVTLNYSIADPTLNNVRQEEAWNYELGLKSSLLNDRLNFNLSAFLNQIDNYQVLLPNEQGFFTDITNAEVRVAGWEAEIKAKLLEGLEMTAGFGYVDAEYTDYTNPFSGQTFDGNNLVYAPEFTVNLAAQYRSPGGLFSRVEFLGLGTYYFDDANTLKQDAFGLFNARLGYEFGRSGVYIFANNLFDAEYFTVGFAPFGTPRANYGDRRVVGIQFRTQF